MTYERRVSAYPSRKASPAKGERGVDSGLERRCSIFLDVLNVFLFFIQIFSGGEKE